MIATLWDVVALAALCMIVITVPCTRDAARGQIDAGLWDRKCHWQRTDARIPKDATRKVLSQTARIFSDFSRCWLSREKTARKFWPQEAWCHAPGHVVGKLIQVENHPDSLKSFQSVSRERPLKTKGNEQSPWTNMLNKKSNLLNQKRIMLKASWQKWHFRVCSSLHNKMTFSY